MITGLQGGSLGTPLSARLYIELNHNQCSDILFVNYRHLHLAYTRGIDVTNITV